MQEKFVLLGNQDGVPLLLYHANAYMPELYIPFIRHLPGYKVTALRQRPLWDKTVKKIKDWDIFTQDLITFCDENQISHINAIGHSLGAVAIWKALSLRPDLFNKVVLIDPVILPEETVRWVSLLPYKLKERIRPIIKIASLRRNKWSSRAEARSHLGSKGVYSKMDPEVFDLFLQHGIVPFEGEFTLAFPRDWEAMIYASPENTWKFMSKTTKEILIIKAQHSNVISNETWEKVKKKNSNNLYVEMEDVGHLIPFEKPKEIGTMIATFLQNKG